MTRLIVLQLPNCPLWFLDVFKLQCVPKRETALRGQAWSEPERVAITRPVARLIAFWLDLLLKQEDAARYVVAAPSQDAIVHLFSKCLGSCLTSRLDQASQEEADQKELCFARCCDQRRKYVPKRSCPWFGRHRQIFSTLRATLPSTLVSQQQSSAASKFSSSQILMRIIQAQACRVALSMQCTTNLGVPSMDIDHRKRIPPVNHTYLRRQAV
ncbi:hypothetical protein KCU65_g374, partial [Aureobasidium melanogenum]